MPTPSYAHMTAEDWDLYTATEDCSVAAEYLSQTLVSALQLPTANEARQMMYAAMNEVRKFGAFDTEPRAILEGILGREYENQ